MDLRHAWRVVSGHPRPLKLMAARVLEWSGLSPLFSIPLDGYRLRFYPTNVSAILWIDPHTRVHDLALFKEYCRPGEVAVDVGANIGEVSVILSRRVGEHGRVFSFEPNPRVFRFLMGNISLNRCSNVTAHNIAVGDRAGRVRMSDTKYDDMNRVIESGAIEVPCATLDDTLPATPIALLKIDVEGSELRVLEGARATLARTECVNCEMGEEHYRRYGYGMTDLIAFLQRAGFDTFVSEERRLRRIDPTFQDPGGHELVAVKNPAAFIQRTGWQLTP